MVPTPGLEGLAVDINNYSCLEGMTVRPVTSLVRRHQMSQDVAAQLAVSEIQQKYRKNSIKAKKNFFKEIKSFSDYKE